MLYLGLVVESLRVVIRRVRGCHLRIGYDERGWPFDRFRRNCIQWRDWEMLSCDGEAFARARHGGSSNQLPPIRTA